MPSGQSALGQTQTQLFVTYKYVPKAGDIVYKRYDGLWIPASQYGNVQLLSNQAYKVASVNTMSGAITANPWQTTNTTKVLELADDIYDSNLYHDLVDESVDPYNYTGPEQAIRDYTIDGKKYKFGELYIIQFPEDTDLESCFKSATPSLSCDIFKNTSLVLNPKLYGFATWTQEFEDVMFYLYNKGKDADGRSQIFNVDPITMGTTNYPALVNTNSTLSANQFQTLNTNFYYAVRRNIMSPGTFVEDVYLQRLILFLQQSKTLSVSNATLQAFKQMDTLLPGFSAKMTKRFSDYNKSMLSNAAKEVLDADAVNQEYCSSQYLTLSTDAKESLRQAGYDVDKLDSQCAKFNALAGNANSATGAAVSSDAPAAVAASKFGLLWPVLIIVGVGIVGYFVFFRKKKAVPVPSV